MDMKSLTGVKNIHMQGTLSTVIWSIYMYSNNLDVAVHQTIGYTIISRLSIVQQ